uniref:Inhibitor of apoptosis 2 n=1 Tax=Lymantria dispar multicapsid nuclear polyhedrosis virus TaxID=10449 RepID=A0A1B1MR44_NPVLD|nr:inhibitor of apoptosis 2 [Lymantria dispar multiple nucleopolyhedrovirus]
MQTDRTMEAAILGADLAPPAVRLKTLSNANLTNDDKTKLVNAGIYYSLERRQFACAFCSFAMKKFNSRALKYHTFSHCARSAELLQNNAALRKVSFKAFRAAVKMHKTEERADTLASCGFYFNGQCRETHCAYCGMAIVKLKRNDDLDFIHRIYSPNCAYVKLKRERTLRAQQPQPSAPPAPSAPPPDENIGGFVPPCRVDPAAADDDDDASCKICFDRNRNVCFLPCRHLCVCSVCARKCSVCCICRQAIAHKIEVFLN